MIPLQGLSLEHDGNHQCEYSERDHLLDDFELHQGERTAVTFKANAVGWHLSDVFEKCYSP